jgi:hypothetical protein
MEVTRPFFLAAGTTFLMLVAVDAFATHGGGPTVLQCEAHDGWLHALVRVD